MKNYKPLICALVAMLCSITQLSAQKYLNNPLPEAWSTDSLLSTVSPADDRWWQSFGDTCLTGGYDGCRNWFPVVGAPLADFEKSRRSVCSVLCAEIAASALGQGKTQRQASASQR